MMRCRGMELLAFMWEDNTVYFSVHQVAVELLNRFDTPRVSVQKKVTDLKIRLRHGTREHIDVLRRFGIIKNFRATLIRLHDTERLYDALEMSHHRKMARQGSVSKPPNGLCRPSDECVRVDDALPAASRTTSSGGSECSPIGTPNHSSDAAVQQWQCTEVSPLLIAEDVDHLSGSECELSVETVANAHCANSTSGAHTKIKMRCVVGSDGGRLKRQWRIENKPPRVEDEEAAADSQTHGHGGPVSSTHTHAAAASASDRFLYMESSDSEDSDVFFEAAASRPAPNPHPRAMHREKSKRTAGALHLHRRPVTKLRHFAQFKSPSVQQLKDTLTLPISIPLSVYARHAPPHALEAAAPGLQAGRKGAKRENALSTFATKKRASSRQSSTSSESSDCNSVSQEGDRSPNPQGVLLVDDDTQPLLEQGQPSAVGAAPEASPSPRVARERLSADGGGSSVRFGREGACRGKRRLAAADRKSAFSFEQVFSYYPPKLVVRNGQLEPAYSLLVRDSELSALPSSHPLLNWSMGKPVKGACVLKTSRKSH